MSNKEKKIKKKYNEETGFFEDGLPYARLGNKQNILVNINESQFEKPSFKTENSAHQFFLDISVEKHL